MAEQRDDEQIDIEPVLEHLKATRAFDFTGYKRATLGRRIQKRMEQVGVTDPAPVLLARAIAVLAVVWWLGAGWLSEGAGMTRGLWALLPEIGRGR